MWEMLGPGSYTHATLHLRLFPARSVEPLINTPGVVGRHDSPFSSVLANAAFGWPSTAAPDSQPYRRGRHYYSLHTLDIISLRPRSSHRKPTWPARRGRLYVRVSFSIGTSRRLSLHYSSKAANFFYSIYSALVISILDQYLQLQHVIICKYSG